MTMRAAMRPPLHAHGDEHARTDRGDEHHDNEKLLSGDRAGIVESGQRYAGGQDEDDQRDARLP